MTIVYTPRPINPAYTTGIAGFGQPAGGVNWAGAAGGLTNLGAGLLGQGGGYQQPPFIGAGGMNPGQGRGDLGLAAIQTILAQLDAAKNPASVLQPALGLLPRGGR